MTEESIANRWKSVVERVSNIANACGRAPQDILTIGVTKYVDPSQARQLYEAGCRDFGESRPQALWEKAEALGELAIRWHMIGHLQRNKVRRTLPLVNCIHSVDSLRLAQQIESDANELSLTIPVLLEVNVSGDANKTGMNPNELPRIASQIVELPHLRVCGLMGMAGLGQAEPRADFAAIRELRDQLQANLGSSVPLDQLSMGMSGDFEAAIQEGSTMIRIGSVLFPS
jgi:pyridoxal phosphate enzyme (YggS family)